MFDIENVWSISASQTQSGEIDVDDNVVAQQNDSTFQQLEREVESIEGCIFLDLVMDPRDHFIRQSRLRHFMSVVYVPGVDFTPDMRDDILRQVQCSLDQMKAPRAQMLEMSRFMPKPGDGISIEDHECWMEKDHAPPQQQNILMT